MNVQDKPVGENTTSVISANWPGVNALAMPLVSALVRDAPALRLEPAQLANGCTIVDAGIAAMGGIEAGRRIAEICMGGLGTVSLQMSPARIRWPLSVSVHSSNPVLACLGAQYAGWSLVHGEGKAGFRCLGSGPGRAAAAREELFNELGYRERADAVSLVLEVDRQPPLELTEKIAHDCGVRPTGLTLILTPTQSLAGSTQIAARVLEVALHKAHALGFPLVQVVDGAGAAPLPPVAPDFLTAMGRTNDAILFGGSVQLFVDCDDADAKNLAARLPSQASKDYGKPFAQVFSEAKFDFYRIDPDLFAPAMVAVTSLRSGRTFDAGGRDDALLELSFGGSRV